MTIGRELQQATMRLAGCSESPRLDAEILAAFVLHQDRTWILLHPDHACTVAQTSRFHRLIRRRQTQVPIPYLTGRTAFYGLTIRVSPAVLIPRPATELLIDAFLGHMPTNTQQLIADVGTGSGAIALVVADRLPRASLVASDISSVALRIARRNANQLGLSARIQFCRGSLLQPFQRRHRQPTAVIANLPYLNHRQMHHPSIRYEPKVALDGGVQGQAIIDELMDEVKALPSVTIVALEFDPRQYRHVRHILSDWSRNGTFTTISDGRAIRGMIARRKNSVPDSGHCSCV